MTETLYRDSVASLQRRPRARHTRPGAHDMAGAPRLGPHDKGILSRQRNLCSDILLTVVNKKIIIIIK